jgi:YHS domain-containing protein
MSFAGVLAFIFADLIVLPILLAYRKFYGLGFALRITGLMYVTMVVAALLIDVVFSALGLVPETRPSTSDVFGGIEVDYKLVLNLIATVIFVALFGLTMRRGVTDPVCGMTVDRERALRAEHAGRTYFFCSEGCRSRFEADHPEARSSATESSLV